MRVTTFVTPEDLDKARQVLAHARKGWAPPPRMTVTQWADTYRILSAENCAEHGQYKSSRAPYQRGPMDAISDWTIETVTIMSSAQVGKNEICHNALGWVIDLAPGPVLWVAPTEKAGEKWSKTRLAPMLRDTPRLRGKVADPKSRDTGNTILEKQFPGGLIFVVGSNAPSGLASQPIQFVFCDEVDRFEDSAGTEGDILDLATKRTTTYTGRRKHVYVSTPGILGASRINKSWEESDQRRYFMPCPHCGKRITFRWTNPADPEDYWVVWPEGKPEQAYYRCQECKKPITNAQKFRMLEQGEWIATKPEVKGHAGFHLNELYSPWRTFGDVAVDFIKKKARGQKSFMTWVNTSLGEPWDPRDGEGLHVAGLKKRRERYEAPVPLGAAYLTLGGDMQDDRWEYVVRAWGLGGESWLVERGMVVGNPVTAKFWKDVDRILAKEYTHATGIPMPIAASCLDTQGHFTKQVMAFTKARTSRRVYGIKGASRPQQKPVMRAKKRAKLWMVDTVAFKDEFFGSIRLQNPHPGEPCPGYVHWPDTLTDDYFDQITSEKVVYKTNAGIQRRIYDKVTPDARNEALDCEVYAMAARELMAYAEEEVEQILVALEQGSGDPSGSEEDVQEEIEAPSPEPPPKAPEPEVTVLRPHRGRR